MKTIFIIALTVVIGTLRSSDIIFDVPKLSHMTIVQIRNVLGKPKYDLLPKNYKTLSGATGDAFFYKNGFLLK